MFLYGNKKSILHSLNDPPKMVYRSTKTESVNNAVAFLIKAIDEDWDEPISVTNGKKKGFSDFEQHDYDFEALEKELTSNLE